MGSLLTSRYRYELVPPIHQFARSAFSPPRDTRVLLSCCFLSVRKMFRMTEEEEGACSTSAAHHSAVALQGLLSSHGAAQVISKVSLMEKDLKRSQRTLSELRSAQQTAGADAEEEAAQ